MTENRKTPKLRFKGFTDAWEQRKLGEICQVTMGQSPDGTTYSEVPLGYILVQGNADLNNGWVCPRTWTTQKTKTAEKGDLILSVRAPAGAVGKTSYNVVIGRGVAGIKGNEFIYQSLIKMDLGGYWRTIAAGSTFESINSDAVNNAKLMVPQDIEEQNIVGGYLYLFDKLITLHQRKLERLKNVKKSMLDKMFPKDGEVVPEIRFKGFTDAWEQRKVSDIGEVITGFTPSTQHSEYYSEDGIPWVTPTDIVDNIIHDTPRKLSPLGEKVGRVVPANTILVTCIASIGKNTMLANMGSFNQQINGLVPYNKKYDPYFLLTESFHWSSKMKREASAGTMQIVNKNEFSAIDTYVPEWDEQKAIGNYFRQLDNLITLHQRKLDKLKNIKKSMLDNMFV